MTSSLSPYALLCASKPKPVPTLVTPYDLYSITQFSASDAVLNSPSSFEPTSQNQPKSDSTRNSLSYPPLKRTHYIADIHARHTAAIGGSAARRS